MKKVMSKTLTVLLTLFFLFTTSCDEKQEVSPSTPASDLLAFLKGHLNYVAEGLRLNGA